MDGGWTCWTDLQDTTARLKQFNQDRKMKQTLQPAEAAQAAALLVAENGEQVGGPTVKPFVMDKNLQPNANQLPELDEDSPSCSPLPTSTPTRRNQSPARRTLLNMKAVLVNGLVG